MKISYDQAPDKFKLTADERHYLLYLVREISQLLLFDESGLCPRAAKARKLVAVLKSTSKRVDKIMLAPPLGGW